MSDKVSEILGQFGLPQVEAIEEDFDERGYLWRYPDVADCIASGLFESGLTHYLTLGRFEGRKAVLKDERVGEPFVARARAIRIADAPQAASACDRVLISPSGGVLLIGWVDDLASPLHHVEISGDGWNIWFRKETLIRSRRADVEQALEKGAAHHFGFTGVLFVGQAAPAGATCRVSITLRNGAVLESTPKPGVLSDRELRDTILTHLAGMPFLGNAQVELIHALGGGSGREIVKLNRAVTREIVANPYIKRFGPSAKRKKGSLVICLYGKAEFMFLQNALFSSGKGIEDYEFVYVSNSPELSETLIRDAEIGSRAYGVDQTVVLLPGNAGFGAANNVAAKAARSDRVLAVNPDVFPRDPDWAQRHTEIIESGDARTSRIFGATLYYDNGTLMHGGMFFDVDVGVFSLGPRLETLPLVRVEHYGKGAPAWAHEFTRARPVPAVTGAFISADAPWFEELGGFSEDYVFGHYEDADLCLKSFVKGAPVWLQDLNLWHLEGGGSVRRPVHDGGSVLNRWLFLSQWSAVLHDGLIGQFPSHQAFAQPPSAGPTARSHSPVINDGRPGRHQPAGGL